MFDLFKKKKEPMGEQLNDFQDGFTKEQKAAIIGSLIIISKADGQIHPNKIHYIEYTAKLLGIEFGDPIFPMSVSKGKDYMISILNTLDSSKKEWYVATVHGMVLADGEVESIEVSFALGICEDIGISEEKYVEIIEKGQAIAKLYFKQ